MKALHRLPPLLGLGLVAALLALPFSGNAYLTTFAFTVLIAYILGQSWDWVAGEMGYVNLGHYAFYGIGAYAFAIVLVGGSPFWLAFVAAASPAKGSGATTPSSTGSTGKSAASTA